DYCLDNPIYLIDPDGMASHYNWNTQQYEDEEGNEVGWNDVEREYGIGEYSASQSVMLFPVEKQDGSGLVGDSKTDNALQMTLDAAKNLPEGNVRILQVKDANDAADQIKNLGLAISNLFITSHGYGAIDAKRILQLVAALLIHPKPLITQK